MTAIQRVHPAYSSFDTTNTIIPRQSSQWSMADFRFLVHALNRHSFNMSILKYIDFDGYLITGQHSGTHWIKWMMSHAIAHHFQVEPPRYFNNESSNELIGHPKHPRRHQALPRIASSHSIAPYALQWEWLRRLRKPPRYAVVIRDVRDILISNYEKWQAKYQVSFSKYVAGDPSGNAYVCDAWWYVRFANRWGEIAQRYPNDTLILHYENFRERPLEGLQALSHHFNLPLTDKDLKAGISVGTKNIMARHQDPNIEEQPIRPDGQGTTRFSTQDITTLGEILRRHLRHDFGYNYFNEARGLQSHLLQSQREVRQPHRQYAIAAKTPPIAPVTQKQSTQAS